MEVLVIDGNSNDLTKEIIESYCRKHSMIKLLNNPDRITPKAVNIGIKEAKGDIIMRMDVHAEYEKNYISTLVKYLDELNCDNTGGVWEIMPGANSITASAIALATSSPFGIGDAWYRIGVSGIREVNTVPYGCFRKELFDKIGLFDEELVRNQDDEFNARLIKNGGKIFLIPEAKIKYFARKSIKEISKMFFLYGFYKPLVNIKIGKPSTVRQFVPPSFVLALVTLSALSFTNNIFFILLILTGGIYLFADLLYSVIISAKNNKIHLTPFLFIIFPAIHLSYGIAYLSGLLYHPVNQLIKRNKQSRQ